MIRDLFPVVVHTMLMRDGQLLLLRRAATGYLDGWYALPGGHLHAGEGVVACALRELREETGVVAAATDMRPAAVLPYLAADQQGIDFIMYCERFDTQPRLAEPDHFDAIGWWPCNALPATTVPYVAVVLDMMQRGVWFEEFNH